MLTKKASLQLGFGTLTLSTLNAAGLAVLLFVVLPNFFPNEKFGGRIGTDIGSILFGVNLIAIIVSAGYLIKIFLEPEPANYKEELTQALAQSDNLAEMIERLNQIQSRRKAQVLSH